MGNSSFTSILILLVLFIVLPTVLKFLGQYTLGSKNAGKELEESEPADIHTDLTEYTEKPRNRRSMKPAEIHTDLTEHMENAHYRRDLESHDRTPVSKEPIKPKWF